jgi:FkbM family methyltransferase
MQVKRNADTFARILNSMGHFPGKTRVADMLGRLAQFWNGSCGTFPLVRDLNVSIDLSDRVQRLMWGGAYEPDVRKCLSAFLRSGDTFVDIGAHIGFFSLIASSLVGCTGKVYAFEANSNVFEQLQANASEYPWMIPSLRAVWSESGRAFFSDPHQPGESGWGKLTSIRNEGHEVPVEAVTLDEWHASVGSSPIRAIKIDAEGSEPFILEGARRMIASTRPILIIELNDDLLREVGRPKEAVVRSLRDQAYRICALGSKKTKERRNLNNPLSPEILCLPSERIEEFRETLHSLQIETCSDS